MFNCGLYETEITPPLGASIYGYFFPRKVEGVRDKLFVKALVIENGKNAAAVATLDMVSLPTEGFCEKVIKRVMQYTKKLKPENIILSATHSHTSGPRQIRSETDALYIEMLIMQTADCIISAEQRMEDMRLSYAKEKAEGLSFIRNYLMADGTVRTNPGFKRPDVIRPCGELDTGVPVLYFYDANGSIKGAMVNFACHHDCVHGNLASSDYSGILAQKLKEHYGKNFICLFLNGFCANVNNWDCMGGDGVPPVEDYIRMGNRLAETVIGAENRAVPVSDETVAVAREVLKLKRRELEQGVLEKYVDLYERDNGRGARDIANLDGEEFNMAASETMVKVYRDGPAVLDWPIHALRIGDCLLYAVPGEMFAQFAEKIRKDSPTQKLFFAELSNRDGEIYVPPIELQGYETVYENHPVSRWLEPAAGDLTAEGAAILGKRLFQ